MEEEFYEIAGKIGNVTTGRAQGSLLNSGTWGRFDLELFLVLLLYHNIIIIIIMTLTFNNY